MTVLTGVPAVPVSVYSLRTGSLPWLANLFPMYGGPGSGRLRDGESVVLLLAATWWRLRGPQATSPSSKETPHA